MVFTVIEFFNLRVSGGEIFVAGHNTKPSKLIFWWKRLSQQVKIQFVKQTIFQQTKRENGSVWNKIKKKIKLTGFLHFEHVTEPQSGQIKRRCFGRAKKPDEHLRVEIEKEN